MFINWYAVLFEISTKKKLKINKWFDTETQLWREIFNSQFSGQIQQHSVGNKFLFDLCFKLTGNRFTLFNYSILTKHLSNLSQLWNGRNLSTLLPLLSIYLLIFNGSWDCTKMSCNTHVLFNCQCTLCTFESHFPSLYYLCRLSQRYFMSMWHLNM